MGKLYLKLEASDLERKVYGYLPRMASCSYAQLGALNAESFCERALSCANLVLTDGNTVLSDEELEMLVILRMNRKFIHGVHAHQLPRPREGAGQAALRLHRCGGGRGRGLGGLALEK